MSDNQFLLREKGDPQSLVNKKDEMIRSPSAPEIETEDINFINITPINIMSFTSIFIDEKGIKWHMLEKSLIKALPRVDWVLEGQHKWGPKSLNYTTPNLTFELSHLYDFVEDITILTTKPTTIRLYDNSYPSCLYPYKVLLKTWELPKGEFIIPFKYMPCVLCYSHLSLESTDKFTAKVNDFLSNMNITHGISYNYKDKHAYIGGTILENWYFSDLNCYARRGQCIASKNTIITKILG